jgi:type I restriction enzyme S subunit
MAGEWREKLLGDVIELKRGYDLPQQDRIPGSVPLVSSSGVTDHHSTAMVRGPGVVTGRYGTLGQVFYIEEGFWPLNTTLYVRDFKGNDPRFVSYFLRGLNFLAYSDKAAVPGLNRNDLHQAEVLVPLDVEEQRAIAHILGTLDDKIELNRRMNETLEAMARALFKSWFVDFDPVRAKAAGRQPSGMDAETAKLFPCEFEESELGDIPKGWTCTALAGVTSKIGSGATPRGGDKAYISDGITLIRSQNVYDSNFVWDGLVHITDDDADKLSGVTVQPEDVLLNITGASILRTCVVDSDVLPARVNQHVAVVRARDGIPPRFIHLHLVRSSTKNYLLGMDAGASRQAVTKGHIESVPLVLPPSSLLDQFRRMTDPLFQAVSVNTKQTRTLASTRDVLLPRLLSGELSVSAGERVLDAQA